MGLPYDYDSVRVFIWASRRKRYETGYIEHNLRGYYPIALSKDPVGFTLNLTDKTGQRIQRKFTLDANRVRRAH